MSIFKKIQNINYFLNSNICEIYDDSIQCLPKQTSKSSKMNQKIEKTHHSTQPSYKNRKKAYFSHKLEVIDISTFYINAPQYKILKKVSTRNIADYS